jgi:hypothetical protein
MSKIISIDCFAELKKASDSFCKGEYKDVLFVFDLDLTLIKPVRDEALISSILAHESVLQRILDELSEEQQAELFNVAKGELCSMEENTSEILLSFKDAGARIIGLTAALTGRVSTEERFEKLRHKQCSSIGFEFSKVCDSDDFTLDLGQFRGNKPCYYNGIIFGNCCPKGASKGEILSLFLSYVNTLPTKIIFTDDSIEHVESVFQIISNDYPTIDILSIEYTKSQQLKSSTTEQQFYSYWSAWSKTLMN